jgi:hypothetical protein
MLARITTAAVVSPTSFATGSLGCSLKYTPKTPQNEIREPAGWPTP